MCVCIPSSDYCNCLPPSRELSKLSDKAPGTYVCENHQRCQLTHAVSEYMIISSPSIPSLFPSLSHSLPPSIPSSFLPPSVPPSVPPSHPLPHPLSLPRSFPLPPSNRYAYEHSPAECHSSLLRDPELHQSDNEGVSPLLSVSHLLCADTGTGTGVASFPGHAAWERG